MEKKDKTTENGDKPKLSDIVKEITSNSFNSLFLSEDSLLSYLKDKKLPRELVTPLLETFSKKREEFYGMMVKEFGKFLSKVDLTKEVSKFLEGHTINFQTKITFEPKSSSDKQTKE